MSQRTGLRSARRQQCGQAGRTANGLRSYVFGALRDTSPHPPLPAARASPGRAPSSLASVSFGRRSQREPRPPERGGWGIRLSSHQGPPAPHSLRLGPAAPLGCGSALQPPAPRCGRGSRAGGRSGRSGRRRQAAYTRLPVLHSEQPEPAAASTAPAAAATASASAAT